MNQVIFTALFIVLSLIVIFYTIQEKETFQNSADTIRSPILKLPESPVAQKNLVESTSEDYAPSWVLATGPSPGGIASFNSLPYQDPSLEKAKYQRILNVLTTLQGFLDNEAPHIQELSDPSIQLPLASARSDLVRLQNEILVLKRNPGIDATVTQGDVDEIEANLQYLQKKWRLSIYNETPIEGFQDASGSDYGMSNSNSNYDMSNSNSNYGMSNSNSNYGMSNSNSNYGSILSNINAYTSGSVGSNAISENATLQDLVQLNQTIDVTIARLGASGTTDPVVLARISSLQKVKQRIQDIINKVNNGALAEQDIPITKSAVNNFLKVVSNTSSPLPSIIGSNSGLASLFPAYSSGDVNGAKISQELFKKYSDMLFSNISFDLNIHYKSPAEQGLANTLANAIGQNIPNVSANVSMLSNLPSYAYDLNTSNNNYSSFNGGSNGYTQSIFQTLTNNQTSQISNVSPSGPSHFDWQERSSGICDAIQKQGMNPKDFGCLRPDEYVSDNFSWRGYAKMICSRLSASMDTGLPETCGCPPATWAGWRP